MIKNIFYGFFRSIVVVSYMAALLMVGLAGWVDFATGHDFSVAILYLVPVFIAAWFVGRGAAFTTSVLCASAWLAAELMGKRNYEEPLALYWNDFMELGFLLFVSIILSSLKTSLEREKQMARTDSLTGAANRRYFYELVDYEIRRLQRYGHPFTVAYIDLDNFKYVNDNFGHSAGDELLRMVITVLKKSIRSSDRIARLGGDEFGLLLPETSQEPASGGIEKVRQVMQAAVETGSYPVTLSIGMVTYRAAPEGVDQVMERVDSLMYDVKKSGGNRVVHEVVDKGGIFVYRHISGAKPKIRHG